VRTDEADDAALTTFVAQTDRVTRQLAGSVRELEVGFAVRTPDLSAVWSANHLCCTSAATRATLERLGEEELAGLPYRHLIVRHRETAEAVEPALDAAGWRVERDVVMLLDGTPKEPADTGVVGELTEDQMAMLMAQWLREEFGDVRQQDVDDVVEYNRRVGRHYGERRLGVVDADGTPLAVTKLRVDGPLGWVEDVYTTPHARNRGYARTLVTQAARAAREAGCSVVVIVADADDWPQDLYARVGFRPIGSGRVFHRVVDPAG